MSRFINYTDTLNEKVSKKEIDAALNNTNVLMGQEFEMKIPIDGIDNETNDLYKKAYKEHDKWYDDSEKFEEEINEYNDKTQKIKNDVSSLEQYLNIIDVYLTDVDEDEFNNEWINNMMQKWISDANTDKIYKIINIKPFNKNDVNTPNKLENISELINNEISDLNDEIEYRENDGIYDEVYDHMPSILDRDYMNYVDYLERYQYIDIVDEVKTFGKYSVEDNESIPMLIHPDDLVWDSDMMDYQEVLNLDDAPFTKYKISHGSKINQSVGSGFWGIEPDSSLGNNGVEIKSPPMVMPVAIKNMDAMFDWMMDNEYYTDNSCGFHAHLSIKGVKNIKDIIDPLKLIMFTDEEYIFHAFKERMNNAYVKSVHNKLKSGGDISINNMKDIISKKKLMIKMSSDHFDAINFVQSDHDHVEFRYLGGKDYEKKGDDIKRVLGTFVHNFSLACDVNYKLKEYIKKLNKIFNKLEYYSKNVKIRKIQKIIDVYFLKNKNNNNTIPTKLNKMLKSYQSSVKELKSVYKLNDKEHHLLMQNKGFTDSINKELKNDLIKIFKQSGYNKNTIFDILSIIYLA
jgi:hypothetical protein